MRCGDIMYTDYEINDLYSTLLNKRVITDSFCSLNLDDSTIKIVEKFIGKFQSAEYTVHIVPSSLGEKYDCVSVAKIPAPYYIIFETSPYEGNLIKAGFVIQQVHLYLRSIDIGSVLANVTENNQQIVLLLAVGLDKTAHTLDYDIIRSRTFGKLMYYNLFGAGTLLIPAFILTLMDRQLMFELDNHELSERIDYYILKSADYDLACIQIGISLFNMYLSAKMNNCFLKISQEQTVTQIDSLQYGVSLHTCYLSNRSVQKKNNRTNGNRANSYNNKGDFMELSNEIIDEITKNTIELSEEYLDIALGAFLEDTQLEKIPIVGTLVKIQSITKSVKSAFFLKKLTHFLIYMKDISYSDRVKFLNRYMEDADYTQQEIGEKLLLTIDMLDEFTKIKYYVNFIKMYALKDEIDYNTFMRLCYILEKIFICDLDAFKIMDVGALKQGGIWHDGVLTMSLSNLGLVMWDVRLSTHFHTDDGLRITPIGEVFHEGLTWAE